MIRLVLFAVLALGAALALIHVFGTDGVEDAAAALADAVGAAWKRVR